MNPSKICILFNKLYVDVMHMQLGNNLFIAPHSKKSKHHLRETTLDFILLSQAWLLNQYSNCDDLFSEFCSES
jgi:hypothetical protein